MDTPHLQEIEFVRSKKNFPYLKDMKTRILKSWVRPSTIQSPYHRAVFFKDY